MNLGSTPQMQNMGDPIRDVGQVRGRNSIRE